MNSLQHFWKEITEPQARDPDEARRETMTRVILAMMAAVLAVLTPMIFLGWALDLFPFEAPVRILLFDVPIALAWWLVYRGQWRLGSFIPPLILLAQAVYGTYTLGFEAYLVFYVLALMVVGMLHTARTHWLMTLLSLAAYVTALWLHGERGLDDITTAIVMASGYFAGVVLLQWFSTSLLQRALAQSRAHAKELEETRNHIEDLANERSAEILRINEQLRTEVAERRQAERALAEQANDLARSHAFISALHRVTARTESTREPDQILTTLGNQLQSLDLACAIALRDPDDGSLSVRYTSIESRLLNAVEKLTGFQLHGYRVPIDNEYARQVVEGKIPLYTRDPFEITDALVPSVPRGLLEQSARLIGIEPDSPVIYLPLTVEEQVIGALAVWGPGLRQDDVAAFSVLAGQVASALENTRLFQAEQRRAAEFATMLEVSRTISSTLDLDQILTLITEQIAQVVDVDGCTISRWDQQADQVITWIEWRRDLEQVDEPGTPYALADFPATRAVLETRRPLIVRASDPDADPAEVAHMRQAGTINLLMLPMVTADRVIGLLELDESQREHQFTDHEIRLCQTLANQAAVAIENARLYESVRRELGERQKAELALQQAHDGLEQRVRERTAELIQANATLQAEVVERQKAEEGQREALTQALQATDALRESEARYRQLVDHAPAGIYEIDFVENRFISVNDVMCDYTGYSREEFLSLSPFDVLTEDSQQRFIERYGQMLAGEQVPDQVEYEIRGKERGFWVILNTRFIYEEGIPVQATVVAHNITERMKAEQALQESEEKYRRVVENANEAIVVIQDGRLRFCNPTTLAFTGYSQEEMASLPFVELIHPDDRPAVLNRYQQRLEGKKLANVHSFRILDKDGGIRWTEARAVLIEWEGKPATLNFLSDITERRRAEEALLKSEALLQSLIESLPQNVYSKDLEGRFTFANQRYCTTAGKSREEIIGKTDYDLHPPDLAAKYRQDDRQVVEAEQVFETIEQHQPTGKASLYVQVIKTPLYDAAGQVAGILGIFWDITERKRAEDLLQALNQASQAMETALTPQEIFTAVAQELKALNFACMILMTDEERRRLSTDYTTFETPLIEAAQKLVGFGPDGFSFSIENVDAYRQVVWQRKTIVIDGPETMRQMLPGPAKIFAEQLIKIMGLTRSISAPLIVEDAVVGVLAVLSPELEAGDIPAITAFAHQVAAAWRKAQLIQDLEKSLAELKQTQTQLVQAQKMEAIGRLAGGIAHDFNNLLTVVQVSTQLLMLELHSADPLREHVQQIQGAGDRATRLTKQLLSFSRHQIIEPQIVDLNLIVRDLSQMLQRLIGEDIALLTAQAEDLWPIEVDMSQLEQVIINLAVNARDAMPRGGTLSIQTTNVVVDETWTPLRLDIQPGEYVLLSISDTGTGMDAEVRDHIFEPFFTTKELGQGTGLGLSTAYAIVKQNQGAIRVDSQVGEGTTFEIYLPRTREEGPLEESALWEPYTGTALGSETILVVEDEAIVRELAVQILRTHGYEVLTAQNGPEALQVSDQYQGHIHLLLTDVVMPEMNGKELADQLETSRPDMCILFMSGYSDSVLGQHGILEQDLAILPKPFSLDSLTVKVRATLDGTQ